MAVFHLTFSVSLHFKGSPVAVVCPSPVGPRKEAQFCGGGLSASATQTHSASERKRARVSIFMARVYPAAKPHHVCYRMLYIGGFGAGRDESGDTPARPEFRPTGRRW